MPPQDESPHNTRADALHERALVLLAHDHMVLPEQLRRDRKGGVTAKVVQATVDAHAFSYDRAEYERSLYSAEGFMADAMKAYDSLLETVDSNPAEFLIVRKAADIEEAKKSGRLGLILGSEGGKLLEGSLAVLRNFYRLGMRHLEFHWAIRNQLGTAQRDLDEGGLTEFGHEVVTEMNRLGMIIDVSHSSPNSIADALATTTKPIINSHTGARALQPDSPQLLWDDQLKRLAENGGVAAVHFCSSVLVGRDRKPATVEDLLAHIEHLVKVAGIESVGLGPDFVADPGPLLRNVCFNQKSPYESFVWTEDLDDSSKLRNLTRALVERGYSDSDVSKILGGNLMRVFESSLG